MKVLWIVLAVIGGMCLLCGLGVFMLVGRGKATFDEAGAFGDKAFTAVVQNWDPAVFRSYAASEFTDASIADLTTRLKKALGPRKGDFSSHLSGIQSRTGVGTTANWIAEADFEKAHATVRMTLISRDGKWQIFHFEVQSPAFDEPQGDEPNLPKGSGGGDSPVIR